MSIFGRWRMPSSTGIPEDAALMTRVMAGDATAFAQLVERHEQGLYNYLQRMVQDEALAADLMQETWLRVFQYARHYDASRTFTPWLFAIAYRCCIDALRWQRRYDHSHQAAARVSPWPSSNMGDPQHALLAQETLTAIRAAVKALPPPQRAVFLLRHYHGLSYQEISEVVDCPVGTVKSRMHHAVRHLQRTLAAWEVGDVPLGAPPKTE